MKNLSKFLVSVTEIFEGAEASGKPLEVPPEFVRIFAPGLREAVQKAFMLEMRAAEADQLEAIARDLEVAGRSSVIDLSDQLAREQAQAQALATGDQQAVQALEGMEYGAVVPFPIIARPVFGGGGGAA